MFLFDLRRYSLRAKRVFVELNEQPFVVELDLRGISLIITLLYLCCVALFDKQLNLQLIA